MRNKTIVHRNCPECGSSNTLLCVRAWELGRNYNLLTCDDCGNGFTQYEKDDNRFNEEMNEFKMESEENWKEIKKSGVGLFGIK